MSIPQEPSPKPKNTSAGLKLGLAMLGIVILGFLIKWAVTPTTHTEAKDTVATTTAAKPSTDTLSDPDLNEAGIKIEDIQKANGTDFTDYRIYQSLKLSKASNGVDGALLILMGKQLRGLSGEIKYDSASHTSELAMGSDPAIFESDDFKQAIFIQVDADMKIVYRKELEKGTAHLDKVFLYEDKARPTYLLSVDYSAGFGSYSGPATQFMEVTGHGIGFIMEEQVFATTLKSRWLILHGNHGCQILYKYCRPDCNDNKDEPDFITYYIKYTFQDGKWTATQHQEKGIWEYDQDDQASFVAGF